MISYIGGKSKISKFIVPYIPHEIETYIEVFGGMYWVFFNMNLEKFKNLKKIVYNDINPLNANVINCSRNYNEFYDIINSYEPQNKELFYKYQEEIFSSNFKFDISNPNYHIASKYVYLLSQVWSGTNPENGKFIDLKGKYRSKFDSFKNKLTNKKWQNYFDKISEIECLDFESVIHKYDSKESFMYLDPPYYKIGEKYYSNHDFGEKDHERLADCLKSIKGRFAMSYYYFDKLDEWFPRDKYRWEEQEFNKSAMATKGKSQTKGVEILIMNY